MRRCIAFLFGAPVAILFSLQASAQGNHRRRETGPYIDGHSRPWPILHAHNECDSISRPNAMLVSVRSLAQRQLNYAWVFSVVIYPHVASVRVFRCFFGDDSAR